ncbi:MAG: sigma-70 family RNA polymerase sigma factor [Pirellulaceae bacterium]
MNHQPSRDGYRKASQEESREKLILDHIPFVRKILSTMAVNLASNIDRDGLESAGIVGLVEAANNFDPGRGATFKTFAYTRIRGAILDELRKTSPVSQLTLQQISLIRAAYEKLEPPVTPEMLAAETGLTLERVEACLEAMRFLAPQDWNDLYCVVHQTWREDEERPEKVFELEESKTILAECITKLPERERLALTLYFAEELTLAEIGEVLEISESYASRLLASAKFRLKEFFREKTQAYLDE